MGSVVEDEFVSRVALPEVDAAQDADAPAVGEDAVGAGGAHGGSALGDDGDQLLHVEAAVGDGQRLEDRLARAPGAVPASRKAT